MPQTFLWWANPAVPVNENLQSIFPPDVHAVMDHGKRDIPVPHSTGVYYKKITARAWISAAIKKYSGTYLIYGGKIQI